MRKVAYKKKDMENGEEIEHAESEGEENGVDEDADPLATTGENGDAADNDQDGGEDQAEDNEQDDAEEDDKPLKAAKKAAKKEKKAAKKAAKKKKAKKRVSLNVPADKVDPSDEEDEEEYEVQNIVDHRYVGNRLEYKIRWKGYSAKDDTWEAKSSLSCPDIIKKYEASHDTSQKAKKGGTKRKGAKSTAKPKSKKPRQESEDEDDDDEDDDKEYEVARLLDVRNRKGKREFLVHWKGWSSRFDNWEPEENLNCDDLIAQFDKKLANAKSATQKELRVVPKTTKRYVSNTKPKGARSSKRGSQKQRVSYYED